MSVYSNFLIHQVARFGAVSSPQMIAMCEGICRRSALYRAVSLLNKRGYLKREIGANGKQSYQTITKNGFRVVHGKEKSMPKSFRPSDHAHCESVVEAVIKLCRYDFVSGIAVENELDPKEVASFCYRRTPDAIIQVSREGHSFELAVEVEVAKKNEQRVKDVLNRYQHTFLNNMPCRGVVFVSERSWTREQFQNALKEMDPIMKNKVIISNLDGLSELKQEYFGNMSKLPYINLEKIRTQSMGRTEYFPMFSDSSLSFQVQNRPRYGGQALSCKNN